MYEGLNIYLIYDGTIPFQHLRKVAAMLDSILSKTGSKFVFRGLISPMQEKGARLK